MFGQALLRGAQDDVGDEQHRPEDREQDRRDEPVLPRETGVLHQGLSSASAASAAASSLGSIGTTSRALPGSELAGRKSSVRVRCQAAN